VSDLFTALTSASRALDAQRYGMDVTGQNIANVNTPGWNRRTIDIAEVAPPDAQSAGGGAEVVAVRALRDRLLDLRLQEELPQQTREDAKADALSVIEATIGVPGQSLDTNLQALFDAWAKLADNPTSAVARQEVLLQGASLSTAFNDMSSRLVDAQRDADRQVRGVVDQVNSLASQIAEINKSIGSAGVNGGVAQLQDRQMLLVRQLSELADVRVLQNDDGTIQVSLAGRALVVADNTYAVGAVSMPPNGYADLTLGGTSITSQIGGGKLAGFLQVRDVNLPDYMNQLDTLAYGIAQQVNALHSTGYDQTGAAGGNFFVPIASVAGAAAALAVDPAVAADVRKIAAAGIPDAGDNQIARALASLGSTPVLNSGTATFSDVWGQLVYSVGRDSSAAQDHQQNRAAVVSQIDALRDQVSGVSLDEEATNLLKFQRAYEANAKFFRACDDAINTLLQNIT
jgi:flagellar hook-associated protein 1 FlgK